MNGSTEAAELGYDATATAPVGLSGSDLTALSGDVRDLCAKLRIEDEAREAVTIVHDKLRPERIRLEAGSDPDGDSEWLVIRADIRAEVDEVLDRYAACKKEWLRRASEEKRGLVRFVYNIL